MIKINTIIGALTLLTLAACTSTPLEPVALVPGHPDTEKGYEQGVSACFAAQIGSDLLMAGGANFAITPVAEGGPKCFYSGIYAAPADSKNLNWKHIGNLPKPIAYGATIHNADSLILVGGSNADGALADSYSVHIKNGSAVVKTLNPLPATIDNMAACTLQNVAFVVGGNANGAPSDKIYARNLAEPNSKWQMIARMPQARVQPVCAAANGKLFVWGGFTPASGDSVAAKVHTDGFALDIANGSWNPLPEPVTLNGDTITLSGGCAIAISEQSVVAFGGVNKDIFADAISGTYALIDQQQYLKQPVEWYKFNPNLFLFDVNSMAWQHIGTHSLLARAGAAAATDHNCSVWCIGGETKPGIRAPEISRILIKKQQ